MAARVLRAGCRASRLVLGLPVCDLSDGVRISLAGIRAALALHRHRRPACRAAPPAAL